MTDAELSERVAVKVVGWDSTYAPHDLPDYATDIAAVFRDVVPAMHAKDLPLDLDHEDGDWSAVFGHSRWRFATTPERAICLAALAALGDTQPEVSNG